MSRLLLLLFLLPSIAHANNYGSVSVDRVVRVYDGDTIFVDVDSLPSIIGRYMPIRLRGVDSPEIRGKCTQEGVLALEAKEYVAAVLARSSRVELRNIDRGTFFRLVATVEVDGVDLAEMLVSNGYGKRYNDPARKEWCNER